MNWWLIAAGFAVHLVFFYSIFDIYFTSPLVHGMSPHVISMPPPAKRLVLFVADGLRADKLYENQVPKSSRAPFLRRMMTSGGAWGVSHTRVPTESRPGHVALIAGFYEDVSAVAKGWKENPVEFDSIFNQSRYTWSWGSPDILPMFAKGASGDHVFTEMYPAAVQDFASSDATKLDTWVFDSFRDFFMKARKNETMYSILQQDKLIFFLHLLGIDTNGHAHKPYSEEYLANIKLVDEEMLKVFKLMEQFYGSDGQTAYVVTSDHGMSDWGSHGAGDPSETRTPLIAWGAGIRKPTYTLQPFGDGSERAWNTGRLTRSDVNQADICPLMASLIGVPFPLNSVGVLPIEYLEGTEEFKAEGLFTNALQILEQYDKKRQEKQDTTLSVLFTPYKLLTPDIEQRVTHQIRQLISEGKFVEAIEAARKLIDLALDGLSYYHHYDRLFLGVSITLGFIGWTCYVLIQIIEKHTLLTLPSSPHRLLYNPESGTPFWTSEKGIRITFTVMGAVVTSLLYIQSLPWTHYLYTLIPVVLWQKVLQRRSAFLSLWWYVKDQGLLMYSLLSCVVGLAGIEIMVLTFFYRGLLSFGLLVIAFWPLLSATAREDKVSAIGWVISSLLLAIFPLLPPVGREANYVYVYLAGLLGVIVAVYIIKELELVEGVGNSSSSFPLIVTVSQVITLILSVFLVWSTSTNISQKAGLPVTNQVISWVILATSFLFPVLSPTRLYVRLFSITLAFLPTYLLLSMSHEGFFVLVLCAMLYFWMKVESSSGRGKADRIESLDFSRSVGLLDSHRKLRVGDLRIAYMFIYLLVAAFFGTGNIASINSFDPATVYCFLTVFDPFVMAGLLLWKIIIPFLLVSCTFNAIHLILNVPTQSLFLLVLLMSDIMGLHFFFLVRDDGSWLEIGTSISHYVMVMCMISFIILLLGLSHVFTKCRIGSGHKKHSL